MHIEGIIRHIQLIIAGAVFFSMPPCQAQGVFCNPTGNVAVFSNYDGGTLRIHVDTNIANLRLGITSYENDSILITGAYAGNVTAVIFAGYFNSANMHCNPWPSVKSVNGVPASIVQIQFLPPVTFSNPNGYGNIVCNYSCNVSASQGGCNTADQVAAYFLSQFGGSLLFHLTQYGCWSGAQAISAGGNCCALPPTGIEESGSKGLSIGYNPQDENILIMFAGLPGDRIAVRLVDMTGQTLVRRTGDASDAHAGFPVSTRSLARGVYAVCISAGSRYATRKLIVN